jgi:hypothetical protein
MVSAMTIAGTLKPNSTTVASAMPRSLAIGASCAADIRPPAATRKNIRYMIQKIGERTARVGGTSSALCGIAAGAAGSTSSRAGALRKFATTTMISP